MHDVAEALGGVVDAAFEKTLRKEGCGALLILLDGVGRKSAPALGMLAFFVLWRVGMRRASGMKRERKRFQSRG
jgi:hypothetical protein